MAITTINFHSLIFPIHFPPTKLALPNNCYVVIFVSIMKQTDKFTNPLNQKIKKNYGKFNLLFAFLASWGGGLPGTPVPAYHSPEAGQVAVHPPSVSRGMISTCWSRGGQMSPSRLDDVRQYMQDVRETSNVSPALRMNLS